MKKVRKARIVGISASFGLLLLLPNLILSGCEPLTESDKSAPEPGNSGIISFNNCQDNACSISWTAATDNKTEQASLQYKVVRSNSANIATVSDAEANGTVILDWTAGVSDVRDSGVTTGSSYYYNVLVRDEAENRAAYVMASQSITAVEEAIYWVETGTDLIRRANLDGSGMVDLITEGLDGPRGLALDLAGGKMYWTCWGSNKIQRANLDGSGIEDLVLDLLNPRGIALDLAGGKMYWADPSTTKIQRANLDGSSVEDLLADIPRPRCIALDTAGGKMYWTCWDSAMIQRANLNGTGVDTLVTAGLVAPTGITLDVSGGKMYWTDPGTDKIQRSNLDGSGVEDLITSDLYGPRGIALDIARGKIYWTQFSDPWEPSGILRANMDGTGIENLIPNVSNHYDLALRLLP